MVTMRAKAFRMLRGCAAWAWLVLAWAACTNPQGNGGEGELDGGCAGAGTAVCGGNCISLQRDRAHCGACGHACESWERCNGGACVPLCGTGQTTCGSVCTSLATDVRNCGTCGRVCGAGEVCSMGTCGLVCAPGLERCAPPASTIDGGTPRTGPYCARLADDYQNCGACGRACGPGQRCQQGQCATVCDRDRTPCNGLCRDLSRDVLHCGACGHACPSGFRCSDGQCTLSCEVPRVDCGGACRDLRSDESNCGACGTTCSAGEVCVNSHCVPSCGDGLTACTGGCRDTRNDPTSCGACGALCPSGTVCSSGACVARCPRGTSDCAGACRDLTRDRAACGGCGNPCAAGENCVEGTCTRVCSAGLEICSGACQDTQNDPQRCGACGIVCPGRSNAARYCAQGRCGYTCDTSFGDCNGMSADGCESDLRSDPLHCGSCANACPTAPFATVSCFASTCRLACSSNRLDCDGMLSNGCEVDNQSDADHCGTCDNACPVRPFTQSAACVTGACGIGQCVANRADCNRNVFDGCEVDLRGDTNHCGRCGNTCDWDQSCLNGECVPTCRSGAANVAIYGPTGSLERATIESVLPFGSTVTVIDETTWRAMAPEDFLQYQLFVFGETGASGPMAATYQAAADTQTVWGPVVTGRVAVYGMDPALRQADYAGALSFLRQLTMWAIRGAGPGMLVATDFGRRGHDWLPWQPWTVTAGDRNDVTLTAAGHTVFPTVTDASLSNWFFAVRSSFTAWPSSFTSLATTATVPVSSVLVTRDPPCVPP